MFNVVHSVMFPVAKDWKQPKCPSIEYWLNKSWSIHSQESTAAVNREKKTICSNAPVKIEIEKFFLN